MKILVLIEAEPSADASFDDVALFEAVDATLHEVFPDSGTGYPVVPRVSRVETIGAMVELGTVNLNGERTDVTLSPGAAEVDLD